MSALALINAERIKLTTIRSPLWTCIAAAVCGLGIAALQARFASGVALTPEDAVTGVAVFGVPVLMVLAAMTVTGEYRTGMIRTTFIANPNRTMVLIAKAVVAAGFAALLTAVLAVAAVLVARLSADPLVGAQLSFAEAGVWRVVGAMCCYAVVVAVLGVGIGALLRHTAGAIALLLLWPLVLEPIVASLPEIGPRVGPYLPFGVILVFTGARQYPPYDMPWGRLGCLLYVTGVFVAVFAAGTAVANRRDA